MGLWLRQSTAVDVMVGPFIDSTDGNTAETGLTVTQAEVRLSKNGGNMAQKNEATSLVPDELGYYDCNLDTTDTNTLGRLQLMIHESGALPVYHEYMVVTQQVWDSFFGADMLQSDLTQISGVAQSATDLKDFADAGYDPATDKIQGVVLVDTTTTNTDMLTAAAVNAEVDTALADVDLDHLIQVTAGVEEPTDGSYLDQVMHKGAGQTFDDTTDSLEAMRDQGDAAWITATTNLALSAAGIDAIWDEVMEGALTARHAVKLLMSANLAKTSGGGTVTLVARDTGDTKNRITLTVDADGNRTASVLDGA